MDQSTLFRFLNIRPWPGASDIFEKFLRLRWRIHHYKQNWFVKQLEIVIQSQRSGTSRPVHLRREASVLPGSGKVLQSSRVEQHRSGENLQHSIDLRQSEIYQNLLKPSPLLPVMQDVDALLSELNYIQFTLFLSEVSYVDFLDRVHVSEVKLREKGLWEVPHPWLNLLVPRSRIHEFASEVFGNIMKDTSNGPVLIYPVNKTRYLSILKQINHNINRW